PRRRVRPPADPPGARPVLPVPGGRRAAHTRPVPRRAGVGAVPARRLGGGVRPRDDLGPAVPAAGHRGRRAVLPRGRRDAPAAGRGLARPVGLVGRRGVRGRAPGDRTRAVPAEGPRRWLTSLPRTTPAATP